jgi:inner membrane protein
MVSGAVLARATAPSAPVPDQLSTRARIIAGFVAAEFPDIDFVVRAYDPLTFLATHRGITHSLVMLPVWAMLLALLFSTLSRGRYSWRAFVGVSALGVGVHIAGDIITPFGTMVFAPLSDWRAELSTTFFIDPFFSAILAAGLLASWYWHRSRIPALASLVVLIGYIGFQGMLQQRAIGVGMEYAQRERMEGAHISVVPQPFSPFNWLVVLKQADEYRYTQVNLIARKKRPGPPPEADWLPALARWLWQAYAVYQPIEQATWYRAARFGAISQSELASEAWWSPPLEEYRNFARFPSLYRIDTNRYQVCIWFQDLQFILSGRENRFRYGVCRPHSLVDATTGWRLFQLVTDENGTDMFSALSR